MRWIGFFLLLIVLLGISTVTRAADYTSSHFIVRDPVIGAGGSFGTSPSFQLFGNGDFIFTGRTPSSGSFLGRFGFLYFPFVSQPTLSGTAANAQVDLSWTTSDAGLGFTVSGYEYGIATTSGGPYSYFNVGNVTNTSVTGLTNATTYYFVVRTLDSFGSPIITSNQVSVTPTDGTTPPSPSSGSNGHFMGVRFTGYAYPQATVSVLKNTILRATTKADAGGAFTITLQEAYDQNILYTLYADDTDGHRSLLLNYPFVGKDAQVTSIPGIKFAPTIVADKIITKQGTPIVFSGFAIPNTQIEFILSGAANRTLSVLSKNTGRYEMTLTSADLPKGDYSLKVHYPGDSRYSLTMQFTVGDTDQKPAPELTTIPGDCNADQTITLQDFSVLAYWYNKPKPPACIDTNHDGIVNLVDFSILAYYWNG